MSDEIDDRPHAPNGDPQGEPPCPVCHKEDCECPEEEEQEPDGRLIFSTQAGCWIYE